MLLILFSLLGLLVLGHILIRSLVLEPFYLRRAFQKQGVTCLPYRLLLGNLPELSRLAKAARASPLPLTPHHIAPSVLPYYYHWRKTYGDLFVFWIGFRAVITLFNPEQIKEVLSNKSGHFHKVILRPEFRDLLGQSVVLLEGEKWAQHRRIVSGAFFAEKVKGMTSTMVACISGMLENWQSQLDAHGSSKEIDVSEPFKVLTADIIAHAAFGSSYNEGKAVFKHQHEQQELLMNSQGSLYIPGLRFIPTAHNRRSWMLNKEIHAAIGRIIASRGDNYAGNDLLGILMAANRKELQGSQKNLTLSITDIVDECKTFFFAGHETTATLMTWTTMLLALNPVWQERTRDEVLLVCGREAPSHDALHNLKTVGMVLNEALRLYPPAPLLSREASKPIEVGGLSIPSKTVVLLPVVELHCNAALWGPDALEFNPQRFAEGIAGACKSPVAFFPFSMGPRNCLGQTFAMVEARAILSMMLQRFRFSLSPGYKHCPTTLITVQPQHGMQIIFEALK